ncbi:MAG: pimeloyl-ACP methyl ester esterase BioH [Pseudomonadales bacterium]
MMTRGVRITTVGDPALPALVLVHGWGHHAGVWRALMSELQAHFYVHLVDLPGYGGDDASTSESSDADWQLDALLNFFMALPPAIWCGWSLGGMLATRFARVAPEQVKGLVTIASNPVFVEKADWPMAMPSAEYEQFSAALNDNAKVTLMRFLALVCQGSESARIDLRLLKAVISEAERPSQSTLQMSLNLLNSLDTRLDIAELKLPQCHLLGEHDALVPAPVANAIDNLNAFADVRVITGAGHAPLLSHPKTVIDALLAVEARR